MRILVAGGAGFIGSHLCAGLLGSGHEVVCVDNLITGRLGNVESLAASSGFTFVPADVCTLESESLPRVDAIFHLASPASPVGYSRHPLQTALANSEGTRRLLELAALHDARFLFVSTSEVYGDPLVSPQPETYWGNVNPIGPRACYDESKRFGEMLVTVYQQLRRVDARIVRIFNTYGPNSDPLDGRVIPNFVTQALRGEPITVYGDGLQTRSLCYVSDIVDGLTRALFTAGTSGSVINLGNPDERTVMELARMVKRLAGSESAIVYAPLATGDDPRRRCPDITRAREWLGWSPVVPLEDGLVRTIEWMRARLGGSS